MNAFVTLIAFVYAETRSKYSSSEMVEIEWVILHEWVGEVRGVQR